MVDYVRRYSDLSLVGADANAVLLDPDTALAANSDDRLATQAAIVAFVLAHVGGGGGVTWRVKSANYTALANDAILADTGSASFTILLPASPAAGDSVEVYDATASFSTNALTVGRNGNKINAVASDMTLDIDRMGMRFTYFDATQGWVQTGVLRA